MTTCFFRILTHKDIPGKNIVLGTEPLLCEKKVEFYGMPIGIVIAGKFIYSQSVQ